MVDTKISALPSATCTTAMEFPIADGTTANNKVNLATIQGAQTKDGDVTITGITTLLDKLRVESNAAGDSMIEFRHVDGGAGVDASIYSRGADDVLVISNAQAADIIMGISGGAVMTLKNGGDVTIAGEAECSTFKMTTGATAGYILKSDAAGAATWGPDTAGTGEFIDARVGTGETYLTLGAAITAGKVNILVVDDVTEVATSTLTADTTVWLQDSTVSFGDFQLISAGNEFQLHCMGDSTFRANRTTAGYTFDLTVIEGTILSFVNASAIDNCPLFNSLTPPVTICDVFELTTGAAINNGAVLGDGTTIGTIMVSAASGAYRYLDIGGNFQGTGSHVGLISINNTSASPADYSLNIQANCIVNHLSSGPYAYKVNLAGAINSVNSNGNQIDFTITSDGARLENTVSSPGASYVVDIDAYDNGILNNIQDGQLVNANNRQSWKITNCVFVQTTLDIYGSNFNFTGNRIEANVNVRGDKNHLVNNIFDTLAGGSAFVVTAIAGATNSIITNNQIANAVVDNGTNTLVSNNSIHGSGPTPSGGIEFVDARVGPGETYTTVAAAVSAGKNNIYVVGNTTEIADIALTQDTTLWINNGIISIADTQITETGVCQLNVHSLTHQSGAFVLNRTTAGSTFTNSIITGSHFVVSNISTVPGCSITPSTNPPQFLGHMVTAIFADTADNTLNIGIDSVVDKIVIEAATNTNTTTLVSFGLNNYIANLYMALGGDLLTHYAVVLPKTSVIETLQLWNFGLLMNVGGQIMNMHANDKRIDIHVSDDDAYLGNGVDIDPNSIFRALSANKNTTIYNCHNIGLDLTLAGASGFNISECTITSFVSPGVVGNHHNFSNNQLLADITVSGDKCHFVNNTIDSDIGGAPYVLTVAVGATNSIITNNQLANAVLDQGTNTVYSNNNLHGAGPQPETTPFFDATVGPTGGSFKYTTVNEALLAGAKRVLVLGVSAAVIETSIVDIVSSTYIMVVGAWRLGNYQIDMKNLANTGLVIEGIGVEHSTILYAQNTGSIPVLANQNSSGTNFSLKDIKFDNTGTSQNDCGFSILTAACSFENILVTLPNFSNCGINIQGAGGQPICNNLHFIGGGINCSLALQPGGNYMEVNDVYLTGVWPINITPAQLDAGGAILGVDTSPGLLHSINNLTIDATNATSDTDKLPFVVSSAKNWHCAKGSLMLGGCGQEGKVESIVPTFFGYVEYLAMMNGRQMAFENIRNLDWSISPTHPNPNSDFGVQFNNITSCKFANPTGLPQTFDCKNLNIIDCVFNGDVVTAATASNVNISDCNLIGQETTAATAAISGSTALVLSSTINIFAKPGFRIKTNTGLETVTITSVVGTTINFTPGLTAGVSIGNEVGQLSNFTFNAINSRVINNNISGYVTGTANHHSLNGNFIGSNEHLSNSTNGVVLAGTYGVKCNNRTRGTITGGSLGVTANNVESII